MSRRIIVAAVVIAGICLVTVGIARKDEALRRLQFWHSGSVQIDGLTYYLNPADEYFTSFVLQHGTWEPEETGVFRDRVQPGDTVIDVGAYVGWYTVIASRMVGSQGSVIAFEPDPTNFALLKRNVEANGCRNVILEQKALSNEPGTLRLFLDKHNKGMHSTALQLGESDGEVEVAAERLDDYLQTRSGKAQFVKIDVEGAEGFVLDGMSGILQTDTPLTLLLEYAPQRLEATGYDPITLLSGLESQGFQAWTVDSISRRVTPTSSTTIARQLAESQLTYVNLLLQREAPPQTLAGAR